MGSHQNDAALRTFFLAAAAAANGQFFVLDSFLPSVLE
jgi:hypothetical protein